MDELVDGLREWSNSEGEVLYHVCSLGLYQALYGKECDRNHCRDCNLLTELADYIEAKYTPNSEIEAKYPYPLDADGVPCKIEDHLLSSIYPKQEIIVKFIGNMGKNNRPSVCWVSEHGLEWEYSSMFHHVEPTKQLTKEDIDAMAKMEMEKYWQCEIDCGYCPSKIDGKTPDEYYEVKDCNQAKSCNLLHKERERVAGEQQ